MKKITLIVALLCSISSFSATTYLVETGISGDGTWTRAAGSNEVKVNLTTLSKTLQTWYPWPGAGTQIWLASGTYRIGAIMYLEADVSIYGGFAGTETSPSNRTMGSSGNPWDFANPSIIDGQNGNYLGISANASVNPSYFDGIQLTNFAVLAGTGANGSAIQILTNNIVQNCIIFNNSVSVNSTGGGNGGAIQIKGGQLKNSYIHNNSALKTTGSGFLLLLFLL